MSSIELTEYARGGGKTEKDAVSRYRCAAPVARGSEYNNLTDDQLSDARVTIRLKARTTRLERWRSKRD